MKENKKWEEVLLLVEHPEDFSEEQKEALLADEECYDIYQTLVDTRQAMVMSKSETDMGMPEIDDEWQRFHHKHARKESRFRRQWAAACIAVACISGIAVAAFHANIFRSTDSKVKTEVSDKATAGSGKVKNTVEMTENNDTTIVVKPFAYDNIPLHLIMEDIAKTYGVEVKYKREKAKSIRLYMRWNSGQTLEEVIALINHFEQVRVSYSNGVITVE